MLKNLILPLSIYRLKIKGNAVECRIKKLESRSYLDLQGRIEIIHLKKTLANLHEKEMALHFALSA
ncbi:MAG: hypothetical protein ACR2KX_04040 [Chitinophagaceae bacterium]|jgi:hypothetical protein